MAMTLQLSDSESAALRRRAEREGRPMPELPDMADVTTGELDAVDEIARLLTAATTPR